MFKIEKDIAIPKETRGSHGYGISNAVRVTFQEMDVGDSFLIPNQQMHLVHSLAFRFGVRIKTKRIDGGQRRVWLVSKSRNG